MMDKSIRLEPLDTMRGFAAIVVACLFHYMCIFHVTGENFPLHNVPIIWPLTLNGGSLVEMFFVISGFLAYLHYHKKISQDKITFGRFLFGRVSRLYPVMYLSLIIVAVSKWTALAVTGTCFYASYSADAFHFVLNLLGMQYGWFDLQGNFNQPSWYVSVLMMCYILFFALHKSSPVHRQENVHGGVFLFVAMVLFGWLLRASGWTYPIFNTTMGRGIYGFFIGVCLGVLLEKDDPRLRKGLKYVSAALLGMCLMLYVLKKYLMWKFGVENNLLCNNAVSIAVIITPSLICLSITSKICSKALSLKCFTWLGKYSYALYLLALPIYGLEYHAIQILGLDVDLTSIPTFLILRKR